ncbi:MAG: ribosome small subunit-dependent GTPase A [Candidatus Xenobia bacterium]
MHSRVIASFGELYRIAPGDVLTGLAGRLRHGETSCVVGDYVEVENGVIQAVLPRHTVLRRSAAGAPTQAQYLAANVDTAFIVCGLDHDFNLRRLERYLLMVREGGVQPVIVLNKADQCPDVEPCIQDAAALGAPVHAISALHGDVGGLASWLQPKQTIVALGSSGAGKSTLTNCLLGDLRQRTHEVRETDSRGRHTTTHRELLALPCGAFLIDTPGLREVQLWSGDELSETFSDITELAEQCRFRDCAHQHEPGCAVRGQADPDRLESWQKLAREVRYQARRQDVSLQLAEKRRWKAISKAQRDKYRSEH